MGAMTSHEAIEALLVAQNHEEKAMEALLLALDREQKGKDPEVRIALSAAMPVLRRAMTGLANPSERKQARSAYRLGAAALGIEHE